MTDHDDTAPPTEGTLSRRRLLRGGLAGAAAVALGAVGSLEGAASASTGRPGASRAPARALRPMLPGMRPRPDLAEGTDLLPKIDHIVVLMMENHSFDNILGMSGRGDGFTLHGGKPTATNPTGTGKLQHAFHMPNNCQNDGISQNWRVSHLSYDHGTNQGFVKNSSAEAMGYFTKDNLPFTNGMAEVFPIADRYFCSALCQTDPNRRYLISGTSLGLVDDSIFTHKALPPNGTIFEKFNKHHISWKDYVSNLPTLGVYLPLLYDKAYTSHLSTMDEFFRDAALGQLPAFSLLEPNYSKSSEENPQDVQFGDQFVGHVVNTLMHSRKWLSTLFIWTYDEHGGYYDHVPPPAAVKPDNVAPILSAGDPPGGFDRYGFRVPAGVVSPYARRDFVSHEVYDHTSILKTVERKWNLPALTHRDAQARDLLAMVDYDAAPAFHKPPKLPAAANPVPLEGCLVTGPGQIPPPGSVTSS